MPNYICVTCGVQYAETPAPPEHCIICEDERQYVGWEGQQWTTLEALRTGHANRFTEMEPRLLRIGTEPLFGIGQHAYLVQAPSGNVLWTFRRQRHVALAQRRGRPRRVAGGRHHSGCI